MFVRSPSNKFSIYMHNSCTFIVSGLTTNKKNLTIHGLKKELKSEEKKNQNKARSRGTIKWHVERGRDERQVLLKSQRSKTTLQEKSFRNTMVSRMSVRHEEMKSTRKKGFTKESSSNVVRQYHTFSELYYYSSEKKKLLKNSNCWSTENIM